MQINWNKILTINLKTTQGDEHSSVNKATVVVKPHNGVLFVLNSVAASTRKR